MGLIASSPYAREVHWHDPRDVNATGVSKEVFSTWKAKREAQAENVRFNSPCIAKVYELMQDNRRPGEKGLDREEFKLCMERLGVEETYHGVLFNRFDTDHDGSVDVPEFCAALDDYIQGGQNYVLLRACFDLFDTSKTGKITQEELETLLHRRTHAVKMKTPDARGKLMKPSPSQAEAPEATAEQIHTMMQLMKHSSTGAQSVTTAMLTFNDFMTKCTDNSGLLSPFMSLILRLMCKDMGQKIIEDIGSSS
eukprot:TRINITY_DN28321_c0_g1_i1.p1 TRINITY_DN28321_c0_g1~~TRINITY_DN28321_c0_g1_i1.p1  ORF type:complete len:252 (+),score=96.59 TRINITY_DN28321_c0_g1_i1:75-830(+)